MRLARFSHGGITGIGFVADDEVFDLRAVDGAPSDLIDVLSLPREEMAALGSRALRRAVALPLADVVLEAPIPRPPKFLGIGLNAPSHHQELRATDGRPALRAIAKHLDDVAIAYPTPRHPLLFNKQISCITGPTDPIWIPADGHEVDFEGELAVVIGRRGRRLSEREAAASIAGLMVCNDVSVRDWQLHAQTIWPAKSFETHGPTGPSIVTPDELDPDDVRIRTWVSGELRQDGSTADYIHSARAVVAIASQLCTLEPGDIIATGTPGGVGLIDGRFLAPGDRVRVEIDGLGAIDNPVIAEPSADAPAASTREKTRARNT